MRGYELFQFYLVNLIIARVSVVLLHPVLAAVHVPLAVHHRVQPVELRVPRVLQILNMCVLKKMISE